MIDMAEARLKHYVATHTRAIVVACVIGIIAGGAIAFTGFATPAMPGTPLYEAEESTEVIHSAGVSQSVSVELEEDTAAFTTGEVLTDVSFYPRYSSTSPVVTGTVEASNAVVEYVVVEVTYRAAPRERVNEAFYTETVELARGTVDSTRGSVTAEVPVEDVFETRQSLQNEFGEAVIVTADVTTTAVYKFETPDGMVQTRSVEAGGEVRPQGRMYSFETGTVQDQTTTGTPAREMTGVDSFVNLLSALVAVTGVIGAGAAFGAHRWVDTKAVAQEIQYRRFNSWVTKVDTFTPQGKVAVAEVLTLGDLVEYAIDTQRRVIHQTQLGEYILMDGSTMLKYVPEEKLHKGSTEFFGMNPETLDLKNLPDQNISKDDPFTSDQPSGADAESSDEV